MVWQGTATISSLGFNVFRGCTSIQSVTIPSVTTWLVDSTYACNGFFTDCTSLTTIIITGGTTIGTCSFLGLYSLTSVTFPTTITTVPSNTFRSYNSNPGPTSLTVKGYVPPSFISGYTSLASVIIDSSVTTISASAFSGCTGLLSVTIPTSVTTIGITINIIIIIMTIIIIILLLLLL